jgi:hypothetical protein
MGPVILNFIVTEIAFSKTEVFDKIYLSAVGLKPSQGYHLGQRTSHKRLFDGIGFFLVGLKTYYFRLGRNSRFLISSPVVFAGQLRLFWL